MPHKGPPSRSFEPFIHRASHGLVDKVRLATHPPRASECVPSRPGALRVSRDAPGSRSGAPRGSSQRVSRRSRALFRPGRRRLRARGDARRRPHDAALIRAVLAANDRDASRGFLPRRRALGAPITARAKVFRLLGFSVSIGSLFFSSLRTARGSSPRSPLGSPTSRARSWACRWAARVSPRRRRGARSGAAAREGTSTLSQKKVPAHRLTAASPAPPPDRSTRQHGENRQGYRLVR